MAKPKITVELQETLEQNPKIRKVYFEEKTGLHHFNHVAEKEGKLTVNGKSVVAIDRKDVLSATPIDTDAAEKTAINSQAIADHLVTLIGQASKKAAEQPAK